MQITDRLIAEHQVFLRQLAFLESALAGPPELLVAIVQTISGPLEDHAQGEEELLFPQLETWMGRDSGPLPVMLAEHADIRETVANLSLPAHQINAQRLAEHLINVLRAHIAKEDGVLFPMAGKLLGPERLEELERQYSTALRAAGAP